MPRVRDYTRDLEMLAELAQRAEPLRATLQRALDSFKEVVAYDLAVVLRLAGDELRAVVATGPLADARVARHRIALRRFPTIRRALESRRPVALRAEHHASDEGDPYDGLLDFPHGHACMVVPLHAGGRALGVATFDRAVCETYSGGVLELAGVYGQLLALAMLYADQADILCRHRELLLERNRQLEAEVGVGDDGGARIGRSRSSAMRRVLAQARRVAATTTPVLIRGETGAGKEVLARAIHAWSPRHRQPFISVNCAAIPEHLIESELFGHVRGAFTGASGARAGRFVTANGGTLLLDEIGDMPLAAQSTLLRVLQEGMFEPVGSDRSVKVDVRVIAATHVDLAEAIAGGRFRKDLYYRLEVFPLHLPPLRERPEDVLPIAEDVLARLARRAGRGPWRLSPGAAAALARHPWPGNVRQLVNALERATILVPRGTLEASDLLPGGGEPPSAEGLSPGRLLPLAEAERDYLERVLRHTRGRIYGAGGAAEILGLRPTTLQSRLRRLGIDRRAWAAAPR